MKAIYLILSVFFFLSCQQQTKKVDVHIAKTSADLQEEVNEYPEALMKVFAAHGGLDQWKKQRTLTYTIAKNDNPETHTTDLRSRHDKINTPTYSMGFDGSVWILDDDNLYQGNPEFYHNLMFYFYAMPFILADEGINYAETEALIFEGKSYPGIQITYNDGVGTSPKDEYYLHYDPETFQMAWLGYTVTYGTGADSDNVKWIRYDDWTTVNKLQLPKSISWYNYEGRTIKDLKSKVSFEEISLSPMSKPKSFFAKPEDGVYFKKD